MPTVHLKFAGSFLRYFKPFTRAFIHSPVSDELASTVPQNLLETLDESKVSSFQWNIMFVSGMGFFTDAYDLFVIGIVVTLLKPEWNLSTS